MIYLPPPQPTLNKDIRISGDVEVHPTASLASGVILQAAPNHKIIIGADVCIGMGAIINAAQGSVEINAGAILGAGVLIIGESKIGSNCCIGTSSTIFQTDVASMVVIEPGSILGDGSRQVEPKQNKEPKTKPDQKSSNSHHVANQSKSFHNLEQSANQTVPDAHQNSNSASGSPHTTQVETSTEFPLKQKKEPVVGQLYINELLITLFPHKKNTSPDNQNS